MPQLTSLKEVDVSLKVYMDSIIIFFSKNFQRILHCLRYRYSFRICVCGAETRVVSCYGSDSMKMIRLHNTVLNYCKENSFIICVTTPAPIKCYGSGAMMRSIENFPPFSDQFRYGSGSILNGTAPEHCWELSTNYFATFGLLSHSEQGAFGRKSFGQKYHSDKFHIRSNFVRRTGYSEIGRSEKGHSEIGHSEI
jgi:hypothetical protein